MGRIPVIIDNAPIYFVLRPADMPDRYEMNHTLHNSNFAELTKALFDI